MAAREGHTDCVKELLSSGAVVDLADKVSIRYISELMRLYSMFVTISSCIC